MRYIPNKDFIMALPQQKVYTFADIYALLDGQRAELKNFVQNYSWIEDFSYTGPDCWHRDWLKKILLGYFVREERWRELIELRAMQANGSGGTHGRGSNHNRGRFIGKIQMKWII